MVMPKGMVKCDHKGCREGKIRITVSSSEEEVWLPAHGYAHEYSLETVPTGLLDVSYEKNCPNCRGKGYLPELVAEGKQLVEQINQTYHTEYLYIHEGINAFAMISMAAVTCRLLFVIATNNFTMLELAALSGIGIVAMLVIAAIFEKLGLKWIRARKQKSLESIKPEIKEALSTWENHK